MVGKRAPVLQKKKVGTLIKKTPPSQRMTALEAVQIAANSFCLKNYAVAYTGGTPRPLSLRDGVEIWIVPVVFTSPGFGNVGEVGVLAIDALTQEIIGATPREEVKKAGARLAKEKRDELDAAFRRARTI
jgi:hypothetical protein